MTTELRHGYCALCISRCGCVGTVVDGILTRVDPDPSHPTGQALCIKARAAPEMVYSPDRILYPMRRTRPKGDSDPGWQRFSWDQALDLAAQRMRACFDGQGAPGLAFGVATPSGTAMSDSFGWAHRLAHACGSPNLVFATENCNWHKDFSAGLTFGAGIGMPEYENTRTILLWGFNPATSWLAQATQVREAKKRGAKLIVVDPRRAGLAASADLWLSPRPGTDGALAMGLAHLMLRSGHFDRDFLANWSNAPFLVREDTGRLLMEADVDPAGDPARPVVWEEDQRLPLPCPARAPNMRDGYRLSLNGRRRVETKAGPIHCRPVFELYAQRCAAWPATRVAAHTGIPVAQIEAAAHLLASNRPTSFFSWTGTCQHTNATQTNRAINVLYALTGCLDAPGGNVWFSKPNVADIAGFEWRTPEQKALALGVDRRPLGPPAKGWATTRDLFRAIVDGEPYPVSCLVSFGSNFLLSKPRTALASEALAKLDFFVLAELYETPTARHADLLLPVCTAWEREGLQAGFQVSAAAESFIQLRQAFIPPRGESRPDTWIVFQLAKRLGLAEQFFGADPGAALRHVLAQAPFGEKQLREAPAGKRCELRHEYRKYRRNGFATPSGRLEIYSSQLLAAGHDPLPDHVDSRVPNDLDFPLTLTTAKWPQFCHSQHRNLDSLRRRMPEPLVEIHPDIAGPRGIRAGDWVNVHTALGSMRARARLEANMSRSTVCAQYGWWQFSDGAGDANRLIDGEYFDPVSGSNSLRDYPCDVTACPEHSPSSAC